MSTDDANGRAFARPPAGFGAGLPSGSAEISPRSRGSAVAQAASALAPTLGTDVIPSAVIDAREEIAESIRLGGGARSASGNARGFEGEGNVQGVAIGLDDPATTTDPGEPVLTVYVAEPPSCDDDVRSVIVDGMGVRAAGDLPVRVVTSGVFEPLVNRAAVRRAPGGFSATNVGYGLGTLGCLAVGGDDPRDERLLCLSNNHVFALSNEGGLGDCICQPSVNDGGTCPDDQIAVLESFYPISFGAGTNYVDCAVGWCLPEEVTPRLGVQTAEGVEYFDISAQIRAAELRMLVGKSGRTTQLTRGTVVSIDYSGWIPYGPPGDAYFANQIIVEGAEGRPFAATGDSGSVVWTWDHRRHPVGLLFAGSGNYGMLNPMGAVLNALDINLYVHGGAAAA
ncbi:Nal1-like putative serine protease [Actinomadura napierensis]|uniref:Nal1 C-terminal domain-containing protein n=1 Tax=Actinomadura napierensis TaxID=267854 RepID=A0ABN3AIR5_9ACTN